MSRDHTYRCVRFDPDDVERSPLCDVCDEPYEEGDDVYICVDEAPLIGGDGSALCKACHHWELYGVAP